MSLGRKPPKQPELRQIIGFTKPKKFLFFKLKPKPIYGSPSAQQAAPQGTAQPQKPMQQAVAQQQAVQQARRQLQQKPAQKGQAESLEIFKKQNVQKPQKKAPGFLDARIKKIADKQKDLEISMREQSMKGTPYSFIQRILYISIIAAAAATAAVAIALMVFTTINPAVGILLALLVGFSAYIMIFNNLLLYPVKKARNSGKEIERDVLFATRDMIIAMRSGMPLYNAIVTVSTGYGAASREFGRIIEIVQLGTPIDTAIDQVCEKTKSPTFNRIMLQSSTSIKAGADVIGALQEAIDEVSQERVIELRRYGQRLNALAMFYMLFGIIFPSMGIAVATIITTFISIITINDTTLLLAFVGITFLQLVFLNMIRSSRPVYAS